MKPAKPPVEAKILIQQKLYDERKKRNESAAKAFRKKHAVSLKKVAEILKASSALTDMRCKLITKLRATKRYGDDTVVKGVVLGNDGIVSSKDPERPWNNKFTHETEMLYAELVLSQCTDWKKAIDGLVKKELNSDKE